MIASVNHFLDCLTWGRRFCRMLALDNPYFSILDANYVGALVAAAANHTHVVKIRMHQQSRNVALESLPWASQ